MSDRALESDDLLPSGDGFSALVGKGRSLGASLSLRPKIKKLGRLSIHFFSLRNYVSRISRKRLTRAGSRGSPASDCKVQHRRIIPANHLSLHEPGSAPPRPLRRPRGERMGSIMWKTSVAEAAILVASVVAASVAAHLLDRGH
ncbi:hypothetical protein [Azorhizobium sp. AG788]|uniref:hypothetical protein n=1 Tax=Azorhizobium sp. AG788 TaxID=2183897 RepID=UPI00313951B8